jgi:hypothetical protein
VDYGDESFFTSASDPRWLLISCTIRRQLPSGARWLSEPRRTVRTRLEDRAKALGMATCRL